jgi:Ser/Thr protein kinase RdoA (MazF antagonist)
VDRISKSFLATEVLEHRLEAAYGFQHVRCQLITATLRDVYLVVSDAGRYILIVYPHDSRTFDEIMAEWRFVGYLAQHAVPVAPAHPTSTGEYLLTFQAPEGLRYAIVTIYVPGEHLRRRPSVDATRRYGEIIATIHTLADQAPPSLLRTLFTIPIRLEQAIAGIQSALLDRPSDYAYLASCALELQARLQSLTHESAAYGIIHGDVIRANALVANDGIVTVIDFDWYGLGWRAYDIASYVLTIRGDPNEQHFAKAFIAGYSAVRTLPEHEYTLLPLFEAIRAILEIGTPAQHVDHWGSAYLYSFFDQSLERLKRSMQQLG